MDVRKLFNGSPKFLHTKEFANMELKTPPFLVAPFFPTGGTGVIFGRGGTGKTQLALSMAMAVSEGGYFLSKFKARKGKVVLIEVDTPPLIMQQRLKHLVNAHTLDNLGLVMYDAGIDVVEEEKEARGKKEKPEWVKSILAFRPDLVIVDSLRKSHKLDENDSRAPSLVINAWRYLLGSGPALLFIHHARKRPIEFMDADDDQGARGSGAWLDDMDVQMQLIKKGMNDRLLKWTKVRTCEEEELPPMAVMIDPESLLVELQDKATTRALELALVDLGKDEIVKLLVKEQLCKQTRANEIVEHIYAEVLHKDAALESSQ